MSRETRKQKVDRQRGHAADRAFDPIRKAIDSGELVITPASREMCHLAVALPDAGRHGLVIALITPDGVISTVDTELSARELGLGYARFSLEVLEPALAQLLPKP